LEAAGCSVVGIQPKSQRVIFFQQSALPSEVRYSSHRNFASFYVLTFNSTNGSCLMALPRQFGIQLTLSQYLPIIMSCLTINSKNIQPKQNKINSINISKHRIPLAKDWVGKEFKVFKF
jgi:hypothetical protein